MFFCEPSDDLAEEIAKKLGRSGLYYGGIIGYNADSKGAIVSNCLNSHWYSLPSSGSWVKDKNPPKDIKSQYVGQIIGRNVNDNNKTGTNYCINPTVLAYGNGGKVENNGEWFGNKRYRVVYGVNISSGPSAVYKADTEYTDYYINNNIINTNNLPKNMRTISDWQTEANRLGEVWANGNADINNGLPYFKDWYW